MMSQSNNSARTLAEWVAVPGRHIGPEGQWSRSAIDGQLAAFPRWSCSTTSPEQIKAVFEFANFNRMQPFIIGVMAVATVQDHHPDVSFGYRQCAVSLSTHSANGVSDNDWVVAAHIEALYRQLNTCE